MAYRCNPCRHTSAPFPIARSEFDLAQNMRLCPECQSDYILDVKKYPLPTQPQPNCGCCKACTPSNQFYHRPGPPPTNCDCCGNCSKPTIPPHVVPPHVVPPPQKPMPVIPVPSKPTQSTFFFF